MARAPRLGEGRLEVSGIEDGSSIWRPQCSIHRKELSVCPNKEVIENVRAHVNTYEDSIRYHIEMIQMAAIKDSIANSLFKEANEIKKKINQK